MVAEQRDGLDVAQAYGAEEGGGPDSDAGVIIAVEGGRVAARAAIGGLDRVAAVSGAKIDRVVSAAAGHVEAVHVVLNIDDIVAAAAAEYAFAGAADEMDVAARERAVIEDDVVAAADRGGVHREAGCDRRLPGDVVAAGRERDGLDVLHHRAGHRDRARIGAVEAERVAARAAVDLVAAVE